MTSAFRQPLARPALALAFAAAFASASAVAGVNAGASLPELPQLQLSAEATSTVASDELTVTLAYEQEGPAVAPLNTVVLARLNEALAQSKRVPDVEARLSTIHTNANWDSAGKRKGWRVRGEVVLRSKNITGLSDLAGKLGESLQLGGASYGVSPELQAKTREALIAQAADVFKTKAATTAKALGFTSYEIANVSLSDGLSVSPPSMFEGVRVTAMQAKADSASIPTEGGTERVSVTFSGQVNLKK